MGFMKDLRDVQRLGNEASAGWDPAAQMRAATTQMQQVAAQSKLRASGREASATVVAVRDTAALVNNMPMVDVDMLVIAPGCVPWPATMTTVGHANLALLRQGASIAVRYDPDEPSTITLA